MNTLTSIVASTDTPSVTPTLLAGMGLLAMVLTLIALIVYVNNQDRKEEAEKMNSAAEEASDGNASAADFNKAVVEKLAKLQSELSYSKYWIGILFFNIVILVLFR